MPSENQCRIGVAALLDAGLLVEIPGVFRFRLQTAKRTRIPRGMPPELDPGQANQFELSVASACENMLA